MTGQISTTTDPPMPRALAPACDRAHWSATTRRLQLDASYQRTKGGLILLIGLGITVATSVPTDGSNVAKPAMLDERYLKTNSATECREARGRWVPSSRVPLMVMSCAKPTPDAGKICHQSDDCASLCIRARNDTSVENICYGWSSAIGECLRLAENPSREICFD